MKDGSPSRNPEVCIPEEPVLKFAKAMRSEINCGFADLREIASGRDLKLFLSSLRNLFWHHSRNWHLRRNDLPQYSADPKDALKPVGVGGCLCCSIVRKLITSVECQYPDAVLYHHAVIPVKSVGRSCSPAFTDDALRLKQYQC